MSHFTVLVIGDDVEGQLAPFVESVEQGDEFAVFTPNPEFMDEYEDNKADYPSVEEFASSFGYHQKDGVWGSYHNPNAKWDWYQIGGRWSGMLKLKDGYVGEVGQGGVFGNKAKPGYVDSTIKEAIDFEGMRKSARERAEEAYDLVWSHIKDTPECKTWDALAEEYPNVQERREVYHAQERIKAFKSVPEIGIWASLDEYLVSKEDYIRRAENGAMSTFAVLVDGQWHEKGEMGWFGASNDHVTQDDWDEQIRQFIEEASDDTQFTIVDCHI
jgi:hypothetical protein